MPPAKKAKAAKKSPAKKAAGPKKTIKKASPAKAKKAKASPAKKAKPAPTKKASPAKKSKAKPAKKSAKKDKKDKGEKVKRAPSSYMNFCKAKRASVVKANPAIAKSVPDQGRALGALWSKLSQAEKDKFK